MANDTDRRLTVELTQAQAQSVIDSQARQITALKKRLRRIHVHSKYLVNQTVYVDRVKIVAAIDSLVNIIECDQPESPEDYGYVARYNHEAIEEQITKYKTILESQQGTRPVKMSVFSYEYQYATNGFDDVQTRNTLHHLNGIQAEARHPSEPDTPNYFSSDDAKNGL